MENDYNKGLEMFFELVPDSLREVILADGTKESLARIAEDFALNEEQEGMLRNDTTFLLLGMLSPQGFPQALREDLGVPDEAIQGIVDRLDTEILNPLYADIARHYDENQKRIEEAKHVLAEGENAPTQRDRTVMEVSAVPVVPLAEVPDVPDMFDVAEARVASDAPRAWKKTAEVVPENLPTAEAEGEQEEAPFIPNLAPKSIPVPSPEQPAEPYVPPAPISNSNIPPVIHPFEQKMRETLTRGTVSMDALALDVEEAQGARAQKEPAKPDVVIARPDRPHDPYREALDI